MSVSLRMDVIWPRDAIARLRFFDVQNDGEGLVRNTFYETAPNSISRKCYFR